MDEDGRHISIFNSRKEVIRGISNLKSKDVPVS